MSRMDIDYPKPLLRGVSHLIMFFISFIACCFLIYYSSSVLEHVANSILIKVNQIGTLTETISGNISTTMSGTRLFTNTGTTTETYKQDRHITVTNTLKETINTDWITEDQAYLIEKLFLSTFKKRNKDEYGNDIYPHW